MKNMSTWSPPLSESLLISHHHQPPPPTSTFKAMQAHWAKGYGLELLVFIWSYQLIRKLLSDSIVGKKQGD